MRFRFPNTGTRQLESGIGNMFSAMAMAPLYQAQAAEEAETAGMKRRLYESQIGANLAKAAIAEEERKQLAGREGVLNLMGANRARTSVPLFQAGMSELQHGAPVEGPPVIGGAVDADRFRDGVETIYGPAMATPADKVNWDQLAAARGKYQTQDVLDQVLAGRTPAATAGQAVAASKGNRLVSNIGNTGEGFNVFSGEGVTIDPGLRTLFGEQGAALVRQRKAAAGASDANAGLSTARRDRVVGGFDKPVTVVDEGSGDAQITRLPTAGQPVTIGVAPKKATGKDATLQKERNKVVSAMEKDILWQDKPEAEFNAEVERRMARRGEKSPAPTPAAGGKPGAPKPGTVEQGYRFKGGDPADQRNWEKVR